MNLVLSMGMTNNHFVDSKKTLDLSIVHLILCKNLTAIFFQLRYYEALFLPIFQSASNSIWIQSKSTTIRRMIKLSNSKEIEETVLKSLRIDLMIAWNS
jgi:hypothetical protein